MRIWLILLIILIPSQPAPARTKKSILTFEAAANPESELHRSLFAAMSDVLQGLGYDLRTVNLPAKRGLQDLKAGKVDGSLGRIGNLSLLLNAKNLTRVNVPLAVFTISRWCRKELGKPTQPIKLGTRLGTLTLVMLEKYMEKPNIELLQIANQMSIVQMLKASRVDCLLSNDLLLESDGVNIQELEAFDRFDLVSFEVYPWIIRKHEHLKSALEKGLKDYPYSKAFQEKYLNYKPVCENKLNMLCPDGLIIKTKADLS